MSIKYKMKSKQNNSFIPAFDDAVTSVQGLGEVKAAIENISLPQNNPIALPENLGSIYVVSHSADVVVVDCYDETGDFLEQIAYPHHFNEFSALKVGEIYSKEELNATKKEVMAYVTTSIKDSEMSFTSLKMLHDEQVPVGKQITLVRPVANVGFRAGMTINLGNYSSAKFEVSLNVPCELGDVEKTFEFSKNWVDSKMETLQEELSSLKKAGKAQ